jgi:hypothetical protein
MNGEPYFHIEWIMDNVFKLSRRKKQNERYWLKDTNSAAEDASGEAGEGAGGGGGGFGGGGGDDFGGGGGDFGGEPGESPELGGAQAEHKHKEVHKHRRLLSPSSTRRWWRV